MAYAALASLPVTQVVKFGKLVFEFQSGGDDSDYAVAVKRSTRGADLLAFRVVYEEDYYDNTNYLTEYIQLAEDMDVDNIVQSEIVDVIEPRLKDLENLSLGAFGREGYGQFNYLTLQEEIKDLKESLETYEKEYATLKAANKEVEAATRKRENSKIKTEIEHLELTLRCVYVLIYAKMVLTVTALKQSFYEIGFLYPKDTQFIGVTYKDKSYGGIGCFDTFNLVGVHVFNSVNTNMQKEEFRENIFNQFYRLTGKSVAGYAIISVERIESLPTTSEVLVDYFTPV